MTDDESYECSVCGEVFDSEEEVDRHVHDVGIVD